jgi:molecular chaperone DnaJ
VLGVSSSASQSEVKHAFL